jgi:uncharacterized YccA/Bax inhibitor family protein
MFECIKATKVELLTSFQSVLQPEIFHTRVPFSNDANPLGTVASLAIIIVAAANLVMDFDFIQPPWGGERRGTAHSDS